jgi:hypothetical protein
MPNHETRTVFGPFHRLLAPDVQDPATLAHQLRSGEIWGRAPSWGGSPAVKAYKGRLASSAKGIEFWSFQAPDTPEGPRIYWRSTSEFLALDGIDGVAKLKVSFVRVSQDLS